MMAYEVRIEWADGTEDRWVEPSIVAYAAWLRDCLRTALAVPGAILKAAKIAWRDAVALDRWKR